MEHDGHAGLDHLPFTLTGAYALWSALTAITLLLHWLVYTQRIALDESFDPEWVIYDTIQALGVLFTLIVFRVNAVWLYRASKRAIHVRGVAGKMRLIRPFWSIAYWILPIVSAWMPFQVVRQLWNLATRPNHPFDSAAPGFFWVWWLSFLTALFLGQAAGRLEAAPNWDAVFGTYLGHLVWSWALQSLAAACFFWIQMKVSLGLRVADA